MCVSLFAVFCGGRTFFFGTALIGRKLTNQSDGLFKWANMIKGRHFCFAYLLSVEQVQFVVTKIIAILNLKSFFYNKDS